MYTLLLANSKLGHSIWNILLSGGGGGILQEKRRASNDWIIWHILSTNLASAVYI